MVPAPSAVDSAEKCQALLEAVEELGPLNDEQRAGEVMLQTREQSVEADDQARCDI